MATEQRVWQGRAEQGRQAGRQAKQKGGPKHTCAVGSRPLFGLFLPASLPTHSLPVQYNNSGKWKHRRFLLNYNNNTALHRYKKI